MNYTYITIKYYYNSLSLPLSLSPAYCRIGQIFFWLPQVSSILLVKGTCVGSMPIDLYHIYLLPWFAVNAGTGYSTTPDRLQTIILSLPTNEAQEWFPWWKRPGLYNMAFLKGERLHWSLNRSIPSIYLLCSYHTYQLFHNRAAPECIFLSSWTWENCICLLT